MWPCFSPPGCHEPICIFGHLSLVAFVALALRLLVELWQDAELAGEESRMNIAKMGGRGFERDGERCFLAPGVSHPALAVWSSATD